MAVTLSKPSSVLGAIISGTAKFGQAGDTFVMKIESLDYDFHTPVEETTGEADTAGPVHEGSGYAYGRCVVGGFLKATASIGLANLAASANTIGTGYSMVAIIHSTTDKIGGTWIVGRIKFRWKQTANFIPAVMELYQTGTTLTEAVMEPS